MVSENAFLLHSLLMGIFIVFLYDLLRIFRRVVPHAHFFISVEDFAYWVYCGAQVFLLMHRESNGTLRWFAVLGALTGMLAYKKTVGPLLVKYTSLLLSRVLAGAGKILAWLCRPFGFAGRKAKGAVRKTGGRIGRRMKKVRRAIKLRLTFFLKVFKMNLKA